MIRPGEISIADFPDIGPRPVIVVSREPLNRGRTVMAVTVTSAKYALRCKLPNCVPFRAGEYGFTSDCVAQCENAGPVPVDVLQNTAVGNLAPEAMRDLVKAMGYVIEADCEPV